MKKKKRKVARPVPKQCVLVQTENGLQFPVFCDFIPNLVEFSNAFNAELFLAKIKSPIQVYELDQFITALHSPDYHNPPPETIEIVEPITSENINTHRFQDAPELAVPDVPLKEKAAVIQKFIESLFKKGKPVNKAELMKTFAHFKLGPNTFSKYMKRVRDQLTEQGHVIIKVAKGTYQKKKK